LNALPSNAVVGDIEFGREALLIIALAVVFIGLIATLVGTLAGGADRLLGRWSWYGKKQEQAAIDDALHEAEERRAAGREFPRL